MKNCTACHKPIGLSTYFTQMWITHITCPHCRVRLRVTGTGALYLVLMPPALVSGFLLQQNWLGVHFHLILTCFAGLLVFGGVLFAIGLATWMRLVDERPARRSPRQQ